MITTHGDQATWFTHYASEKYVVVTVRTSTGVQTTHTEMICGFFLRPSKYQNTGTIPRNYTTAASILILPNLLYDAM